MKSAFIKEIEIENYRVFKSVQIRFNPGTKKNVSVVQGTNGFGKSNLFNAINWCFFGTEPHLRKESKKLPVCNTGVLKALKGSGTVQSKVCIVMGTSYGEKRIERTVLTRKTSLGVHCTNDSILTVTENIAGEWKVSPNPEYTISRILPESMSSFFFIDGEMLREMFENISPDKIRDAIFDLSQVTLLQKTIDHLDSFAVTIRKEGSVGNDNGIQMAEDQLEIFESNIAKAKEQNTKDKADLETAIVYKRQLDDKLAEVDSQDVKRLDGERRAVEMAISVAEDALKTEKQNLREQLSKVTPLVMLGDAIGETLQMLKQMEQQNRLPKDYEATFIQQLLDRKECICGIDLSCAGSKKNREKLIKLLKECDEAGFSDLGKQLLYRLEPLKRESSKALARISACEAKNAEYDNKLSELQKRLKEVNMKIGDVDLDVVKQTQSERDKYLSLIQQCNARIGRRDVEIRKWDDQKNDTEKILRRMMEKQQRLKIISERIEACRSAQVCLRLIMEKLMNEIRLETEAGTQKFFGLLVSEKNFNPPKIDESYSLVVEKDGYNAVTSLSAAETLCMGYSFMAALRATSGFLAPIVIDTPLAKISAGYRKNVATWMKEALHDAQIILLVSDVEYTEEFRREIAPVIADEQKLVYNADKGFSEVHSYGK